MDALVVLICLSFGVLLAIFCFHGLILLYYGTMRSGRNEGNDKLEHACLSSIEPSVPVVIPTRNEEYVVARRIENLLASNYSESKLETIFVDDSVYSTSKIEQ
jgi:cellulose synthase/poly-beta-1,6-N-acetylglucosamine synthase-like glycosyltransferase